MVPDGWKEGNFGEFVTLQRGFDLPVHERLKGDVPVWASNGIIGFHAHAAVGGPGVVTGRSGTLGRVSYVEGDFWPLNTALYVRDFHGNDPRFISYFLTGFSLETFGTGTGIPTLNRNVVHAAKATMPPLAEQRRIAAVLQAADDAVAAAEAVMDQTEKVKRGLVEQLLTRGMPGKHTRFKMTEIGEVPESWEVVPLQALAEVRTGIAKGKKDLNRPVQLPYLRVANVQDGHIDLKRGQDHRGPV